MNPLLLIGGLGILAFALMASSMKPTTTQRPYEGSPSDPDDPWRLQWTPSGTVEVPYAGFRGGGVSGTVQEEYLPPLGTY